MIKKKAKKAGKAAGKTKTKEKRAGKQAKETHPEEVRKEVSRMVESEAKDMAQAAINRGKSGELATVKYLFEMAGVFPRSTETEEGSAREDSLAETLLHRLNIPLEPVKNDADDEPVILGAPTVRDEDDDDDDGGGSGATADAEGKPVEGKIGNDAVE